MFRNVILACPDYSQPFEINTDISSKKLGAVILQNGWILAYFCRKQSEMQTKYSVTKMELLSVVECIEEFRGILWGQHINVFMDNKNLIQDVLGLTSNHVYCWSLLLEEYVPEITYTKGVYNAVADTLSRLEESPKKHMWHLSSHMQF